MTTLLAHDIQQRIARRRRQGSRRDYLGRLRLFLAGRAVFACVLVALMLRLAVQ